MNAMMKNLGITPRNSKSDRFKDGSVVLGRGGFGEVRRAEDLSTTPPTPVAVKLLDLKKVREASIQREYHFMTKLGEHPNINGALALEVHGSTAHLYLQLADGGELFDQVIETGGLSERRARVFFSQLVEAIAFSHTKGVAHRDLKLENVMLTAKGDVQVIDWGLAHEYPLNADGSVDASEALQEFCGSPSYAAPEVYKAQQQGGPGYSGFLADSWSLGVCLFAMLAGFFPFDSATSRDWRYGKVLQAQAAGQSSTKVIYGFYNRPCALSTDAINLLDSMLAAEPSSRIAVERIASHAWVKAKARPVELDYDDDDEDGPVYRSAGIGDDDDDEADGPIYRAAGSGPVGEVMAAPTDAPMLGRQRAVAAHHLLDLGADIA